MGEAFEEDQDENEMPVPDDGDMPLPPPLVEEDAKEEEDADEQTVEAAKRRMMEGDAEEESEEEEDFGVAEHLKDSIEGSQRLKRMIEGEIHGNDGPKKKKQKVSAIRPAVRLKTKQLLMKWGLERDTASKYVLERAAFANLRGLYESNWNPLGAAAQNRSPCELIDTYMQRAKERHFPSSGQMDSTEVFSYRWKLSRDQQNKLRGLNYKDLQYVIAEYDGTEPLEDIIANAKSSADDEDLGRAAVRQGPKTMGRLLRLELIDPLADSLIVGDANLTFAVCLAKHRECLGHVGRIVATTFEPIETLRERYKEIDETIAQLETMNSEVWHDVDCTRLAVNPQFEGHEDSFGAVYYNYPHSGAVKGFFDSHPFVRWRHENLMHLFFRALTKFVKVGGSVKVASNAGAVGVRYSDIIGGAARSEFVHVATMPFQEWCLHRYGRSYGDRRDAHKRPGEGQNYNAQKAGSDMVYCFCYAPTGEKMASPHFTCPPSKTDLLGAHEGPLKTATGDGRKRTIEDLYSRFVSEVQGVHVG